MRDKDLVKLLKQNGWKIDRIQGSHHIMVKGNKTECIPVHGKDVPTGLLNVILKRTGLK
jgi:predicted RNA binding protein YcfA (HicA-like mRNA interferase family)